MRGVDRARSSQRRQRREEAVSEESESVGWFEAQDSNEQSEIIEAALKKLPPAQQEIILLKVYGDQTFAEVAEILDISPNTAASRYRYAIEGLRKHLPLIER